MATAPSAVSSDSEIILRDDNVTPLSEELSKLYSQGFLTDITLSTEDGKNFEAHRVLLAARSHYFHSVVPRLKSEPVIFLKGVKGSILDKILKYIYGGSVGVSKHQVRPLLEVAKSLQVKGLQDLVPGQVSGAKTQQQQQQHRFGRLSLPLGEHSGGKALGGGGFKSPLPKRGSSRFHTANGGSDNEELSSNPNKEDSESEEGSKPKRKRGRPPKATVKEESSSGKRKQQDASDPYDFEEEDAHSDRKSWRSKNRKKKEAAAAEDVAGEAEEGAKAEDAQDGEDEENANEDNNASFSSPKKDASLLKKTPGSSINGKQVIPVKCKGHLAELHISRFASGVRGQSIRYKDTWMTPQNFEVAVGCTSKYYLENIQTDYGPLKTLTASGMLKPHSRKCRCSLCRGEEPPPVTPLEEEDAAETNNTSQQGDSSRRASGSEESEEEDEEESESEEEEEDDDEEEKRRMKKREEWSRQLEAKLKSEYDDSPPQITPQVTPLPAPPTTPSGHLQGPHILSTSPLVISNAGGTLVSGAPPSSTYISILDQPPKISPSILPSNGPTTIHTLTQQQQPERIDTPQTLFVMSSPHPHISAPPTPTHNPFANLSHSIATQISQQTQPTVTLATAIPQQQQHHHHHTQQHHHQQQQQAPPRPAQSRIGSVMQVRCKSTTALLYANKYESGSRGKCIQLGDEWLTPNEFEDRAGSKAKKYLSSIKCLGRPLRVYVNSGELRGTGNAGQAKFLKDKMKAPQPIAPAPPPPGLLPSGAMNGGGIQAPPTPTHVSGSLPPNLNMAMMAAGPHHQPPILINQTSMAGTSLMGSPSIITGPMTVALGSPPFEVRHSQAM